MIAEVLNPLAARALNFYETQVFSGDRRYRKKTILIVFIAAADVYCDGSEEFPAKVRNFRDRKLDQ